MLFGGKTGSRPYDPDEIERQRRLLEIQQAVQNMGAPEAGFAPVSAPQGKGYGWGPEDPAHRRIIEQRPDYSMSEAPIIDAPAFPLHDAPMAPRPKGLFGRRGGSSLPGGYSPYEPLPEQVRNSTDDLNQYGGIAPEKHRNFGQQVLRALPVVAAGLFAPQAAGAIIRQRKDAASGRQFDRMAFNQLVHQGISPAQALIMMADPKSMASNYNQQLSPYTLNPGDVRGLPGQGMVRNPGSAEQYAAAQGFKPGTPEWNSAIQDYQLRGDGPTGFKNKQGLQDDRLESAEYIASMRDGTTRYGIDTRSRDSRYGVDTRSRDSRYGVDTRDRTTRRGQEKTPVGTFVNDRGEPVVGYKDGTVQPFRNARPMGRSGSGSGRPGISYGGGGGGGGSRPRARNKAGQVVEWNGSAWVPAN